MYKISNIFHNKNGDNMDYVEAFRIIPRSIGSLICLFFITKLMGKKQVSELSLFDYVIGISIGNFTAEMVMNFDYQYINGIVAIVSFGLVSYLVSVTTLKSIILRRFLIGVPTVLIEDGKINVDGLQKAKMDVNDLLEECRGMNYFDISEISYAILEVNGKLSVLPKAEYRNPTLKDLKIKSEKSTLSANVIIDGNLMEENLKNSGHSLEWLEKELKKQGHTNYENILLATITNKTLTIFEKRETDGKKVLE